MAGVTFAGIIELITTFLKFPDATLRLIKVLKKTPQEKHEDIVKRNEEEFAQFEETGRPTW